MMALLIYRAPRVAPFADKGLAPLADKTQQKWLHSLRNHRLYSLTKTRKSGFIP